MTSFNISHTSLSKSDFSDISPLSLNSSSHDHKTYCYLNDRNKLRLLRIGIFIILGVIIFALIV